MANEQNILPHKFQPGQSGNPAGKIPGTKNRSTIVRKWLDVPAKVKNIVTKEEETGTVEDMVVLAAIKRAIDEGDMSAIKEIMDSAYGKAPQSVKVSGDEEAPLQFVTKYIRQPGNEPLPNE